MEKAKNFIKFGLIGLILSIALTYLSLELLPKVFTVLPSHPALIAIVLSVAIGFAISAYFTFAKSTK